MKFGGEGLLYSPETSHPARGAWIEMNQKEFEENKQMVAPRKGCVD